MGPGAWAGRRQRGVGRGVVQAGEADGGQDGVVGQRRGRAGQNRASARETTTTGGCDKQRTGGSAAERLIDGRTNEQLNERAKKQTMAHTDRMTKAETQRR